MQNENQTSEQIYKQMALIWASLFMSQFVLLAIVYFSKPDLFKSDFSKPLLGDNVLITSIFAIISVYILLSSFVLSKRSISKAIEKQDVGLLQTAMIFALALTESVSMFGIILAFVFNYQYFFIWFAVGILGMIFHFPKRENIHLATFKKPI